MRFSKLFALCSSISNASTATSCRNVAANLFSALRVVCRRRRFGRVRRRNRVVSGRLRKFGERRAVRRRRFRDVAEFRAVAVRFVTLRAQPRTFERVVLSLKVFGERRRRRNLPIGRFAGAFLEVFLRLVVVFQARRRRQVVPTSRRTFFPRRVVVRLFCERVEVGGLGALRGLSRFSRSCERSRKRFGTCFRRAKVDTRSRETGLRTRSVSESNGSYFTLAFRFGSV